MKIKLVNINLEEVDPAYHDNFKDGRIVEARKVTREDIVEILGVQDEPTIIAFLDQCEKDGAVLFDGDLVATKEIYEVIQ